MNPSDTNDDALTRRQARLGLALYFAMLVPLSALIQLITIRADLKGGENGAGTWLLLMTCLMAVPTVTSVAARLILREGFADVSFRFGGRKGRNANLLALITPLIIGTVVYGTAWSTGLASLHVPEAGIIGWAAAFVIVFVLNILLSTGEEIGWRGFMLTRIIDAGVPRPVLVSGLIWASWHIPLVLWAGYASGPSPILSAVLLMVSGVSLGYMHARLRLETGSVWPTAVLHIAWNTIIQAGFDPATAGMNKALWTGESGILTVVALIVAAVFFSRGSWSVIRTPAANKPADVRLEPTVRQVGAE